MRARIFMRLALAALWLAGGWNGLRAQTMTAPWFVVAGGGGTAAAGNFSFTGTFGQWEANPEPLAGGIFTLTGGFWSFLSTNEAPINTLFEDDFSGSGIDATKWITSGHTVLQTNGTMEVLTTVTDDGGLLTSVPFTIATNGLITITRQVYLHAAPSPLTNFPGTFFMGQFGISAGAVPQFSVYYADFDYGDGVTYLARHGFFLARDGQSPLFIADQSDISAAIAPLWDTWFDETVTYDPASGAMEYFINNASQMSFNVGALPPTPEPTMTLTFNAWGWWTNHEQSFQDLYVTQAPGASNTAPAISLAGNLAFGGVAVGSTSNLTLTISNAGSGTLNVSNIVYPAGFSGAFSAPIAPGAAQAVTVAFSPAAVTNYGGVITVNSDSISGANTMAVSGYGASGTLELIIDIVGEGLVAPNMSGKALIAGKNYTVRAVPKSGNVFIGWTGSTNTTKNPLTFAMQPSTLLVASFVPSPFAPAKDTYNGLFATTNGVTEETAGMLKNLVVGAAGNYSGTLWISGAGHAIAGTFTPTGQASNHIARAAKQGGPISVLLALDLGDSPPQISGTVAGTNGGAWTANLSAGRATNAGSGEFTMVLAPTILGMPGVPSGYGYLLLAQHGGTVSLSGALADGAVVNQTVPEDASGRVPIYASLYGNTGLVTGWASVSNGVLGATLDWIKKPARTGFYTNGFTNSLLAQGAVWTNRSPAPAIGLTNGQLNIMGGTLAGPISFDVGVSVKNALTNAAALPTNFLSGTINPRTGLLTVTFGNGDGKARTVGKAAVLQDTTNAAGFFLDKTNAGSVILE